VYSFDTIDLTQLAKPEAPAIKQAFPDSLDMLLICVQSGNVPS